jgi:hypothetical protein
MAILFLTAKPSDGQTLAHYRDQSRFHFGFVLGLNVADSRVSQGNLPLRTTTGDSLVGLRYSATPGINIGLIANLKLDEHLDLRFIPAVSLQQRDFFFDFIGKPTETRKIEASFLNLPLLLQYKSDVYKNYRVFVNTGPQVSLNLSSNERVQNDPTLLRITKVDYAWRFGFGMNLYGDRVKLSPELSYSFGLRNVYVPGGEDVAGAIRSVFISTFALSFCFEQ